MENTRGQGRRTERTSGDSQERRNMQPDRNQQTSNSQESENLDQQYISSGRENTGDRNRQSSSEELNQKEHVSSKKTQSSGISSGALRNTRTRGSDISPKRNVTGSEFDGQVI